MDYHIAAGICSAALALAFLFYKRKGINKRQALKNPGFHQPLQETLEKKPDLISSTAQVAYKTHRILSMIMGVALVSIITYEAFVDRLTRIIVLTVIAVMIVAIIVFRKRVR